MKCFDSSTIETHSDNIKNHKNDDEEMRKKKDKNADKK